MKPTKDDVEAVAKAICKAQMGVLPKPDEIRFWLPEARAAIRTWERLRPRQGRKGVKRGK